MALSCLWTEAKEGRLSLSGSQQSRMSFASAFGHDSGISGRSPSSTRCRISAGGAPSKGTCARTANPHTLSA
eukprot:1186715-Prorocentrum_minimum.AAC.1